jgi:hypothetical protein
MNKSVDFARIRGALAGKKLLGYNLDPANEMVPTADTNSKANRPAIHDAKIGAVKIGARKIGIRKIGFNKQGLVKHDPTKRSAEA